MTAPLHRIIEGLRYIEQRFQPAALVRGKVVAREQEARFLMEMVADAREVIENPQDHFENEGGIDLLDVGPQIDAEMLAALKALIPILEAVRYTAGLGKTQMERVERARAIIAKADRVA